MEEMERWVEIRQICGREPLQWFLVNHIKRKLAKEKWSQYEALRRHYDKRYPEITFEHLEEIAKWIWLQHFFRGLQVLPDELGKKEDRIGLFYYEWDLEELSWFP